MIVCGYPFGLAIVNGLVITGTYRGRVSALDRATGAIVWTWTRPATLVSLRRSR
ncbi:PQQ-binding-like beta-propeller repeat protein [Candidatus Binatia bacterium]|nr:PQQ-binding-like beta-propeller repeat protein [Candidatus Binatia bacterium]